VTFKNNLTLIQDGEAVSAEVANRPLIELLGNTAYLRSWLAAMSGGSALFLRSQPIDPTVLVGQPVYWNRDNFRFEAARLEPAMTTEDPVVAEPGQVWGILHSKLTTDVGIILLYGYAEMDLTLAVDELVAGEVPAGTWYLAPFAPGTLTRTRPTLAVPVLRTFGSNQVHVSPTFQDFEGKHRHYAVPLSMYPAGETAPPIPGDPHVITAPNNALPGWLPATDPIFGGNAPLGAVFGYNILMDPAVRRVFPPLPANAAAVIMQRPSVYDVAGDRPAYGQQLFEDTVVVNSDGIWWMTDCYDSVPWPTLLDTAAVPGPPPPACDPQAKQYSLMLYMNRLLFSNDNAYVQSLQSTDPRLRVYCRGTTTPSSTGHLDLALDLGFLVLPPDTRGHIVLKGFDPATQTFSSGSVLEAVRAGTSNVTITGGTSVIIDGLQYRVGPVSIGVVAESQRELTSQLVRLDGVTEESFPVLYLGMPNTNTTSLVMKFDVPTLVPANMLFQLRLQLLGRAAGTLPPLTLEYYTVGRPPNGLITPIPVSQAFLPLTLPVATVVAANQAVEAISHSITVQPGDSVYLRITRTPSSLLDGYNGEVGIMRQVGVLSLS
jgi:hypothetical protein